jgi:2-polyprenyl-3-methyl-5-hydroxy-6-metoxy-1,4-benzoquinol methylase
MDKYKITFQTWNEIANIYQEYFMDLDMYNDTYDLFCDLVKKENAKIFEIGCGPGNITRYLLRKRPDFEIEAIDVAPNMIQLAKINNPTATFKEMDCRDISAMNLIFDAIMCGFCIPYLSKEDCAKLINDSAELLNSNGIIYLSAIEGDYNLSGYETSSKGDHKAYVYYYKPDFIQELLELNNFKVVELFKKSYTKSDGTKSIHLIFIAQKI